MTATLDDVAKRKAGEPSAEQQAAAELVRQAREQGLALTGPDGLLKQLTKTVLETALNEELTEHLGYDKRHPTGAGSGNIRNGTRAKTVLTEATGQVEIGLTTGEISAHFAEIYGASVSKETISRITDKVIEEMNDWAVRPLDAIYAAVFIDAVVVKVRDGQVANRPFYAAIGVTLELAGKWGTRYPAVVRLWDKAWAEFIPFLDYDLEIRRVICSTNAIESLNARYRRAVKARGHFPSEQAALKCLYLVTRSLDPTGAGRARWVTRWKPALNAFAITFGDRLPAAETY